MADHFLMRDEPLHEKAYQRLRSLLVSGRFAPGQTFGETSLAQELGVSRTPVRDALRRLQQDRLITLLPNGSYAVCSPSVKALDEIHACSYHLEALAARGAAAHRTDADLRRMTAINEQMGDACQRGDEPLIRDLDDQFHDAVVEASGNTTLGEIIAWLRGRLLQARNALHKPGTDLLDQHQRIFAAIAAGDCDLAEQVMREHIGFCR